MTAGLLASAVLAGAVRVALAAPTPVPGDELDAYDISPGLLGFLVTFAVVAGVILLLVNMTARLRRLRQRAEEEERAAGGDGAGREDGGG